MTFIANFRSLTSGIIICAALAAVALFDPPAASAQQSTPDLFPSVAAAADDALSVDATLNFESETHPPLRLTPDKSEILTLDQDVSRVIIGNEVHLNILMDSARRMIVVPRVPGATHFTLMNAAGKIVMQRHAIVANPKENYVRIRSTCLPDVDGCMPIRMYYCPGMCHEVAIIGEGGTPFSGSIATEGTSSAADGGQSGTDTTGSEGEENTSSEDEGQ